MSRHTVTGGADFLEVSTPVIHVKDGATNEVLMYISKFQGVFFTTLIAYCLKFGQFMALKALGEPETDEYLQCTKGVSQWYVVDTT